jgi:hypothetical protein
MAVRGHIDPQWQQNTLTLGDALLQHIGALQLDDAKRVVHVRTGRLKASLDAEVDNHVLRVGSRDVDYSIDVELGTSQAPPHPYLRPALYQQRHP